MNTKFDGGNAPDASLQGEKNLTEMIARGDPLDAILNAACRIAEESFDQALAIVMLLDQNDNRLRGGAAPSFPDYMAEVDGFLIDCAVGTCSAAAARRNHVITYDITTDPQWANYRDLASRHGLRAGWSAPVLSSTGRTLGTFALYWREPCNPTAHQLQIINQIARLLSFAIERKQAADALQASEQLARGQAAALTQALDALATETNPDKIVEHVLRTVVAQLDAHSCSTWLRDEASGLMVFEFALEDGRFKTKSEAALAAVSPSLPVSAIYPWPEIFRTGMPAVVEDVREGPTNVPWRAHLLALGIVTILVVPMMIAGKVEGVVGVRFTHKREFRPEELELAQSLAHQAMLAIQLARLSALSRQAAVIEERNRMARDIHDTLAQGFTGVIMHLEAAKEAISRHREDVVSNHVQTAGELARDGLREAQRSVRALRPLALEKKKLAEALEAMVKKLTAGTGIRTRFAVLGVPRKLPPEWDENILRIEQELLTNVLRHARASELDIQLVFDDAEIRFEVRDNGCGFLLTGEHGGFGLLGMAERAENMGGTLSVESKDGAGAAISVVLPIAAFIKSDTHQSRRQRHKTGITRPAAKQNADLTEARRLRPLSPKRGTPRPDA